MRTPVDQRAGDPTVDDVTESVLEGRTLTAEEAAQLVRPGNRVFVGTACGTPRALVAALENLADPPADVTLVHTLTDRVGRLDADGKAHTAYRHRVYYVGSDVRDLLPTGLIEYVPVSLADVPAMFTDGHQPLDVALVQVAPPDDDGMCSLGVSVDITRAAVMAATTVIAEINPAMPHTRGDSMIPAERIDHAVLVDTPVTEYLHEEAGGVGEQIARYVARLVDDRSTLQIGLGRVPNQMLQHLKNRHDLSVHSEVITEPIADLVEQGRDHRPRGRQLGDGHPAALRHARVGRPLLHALDRARLRPGRDRPARPHGLGHPGVLDRPVRDRCAPSCSTGSSTAGCRPVRTSTAPPCARPTGRRSSASPPARREVSRRSSSTWGPTSRSRWPGPWCAGWSPSTAPPTCSASPSANARWP